MKAKAAIYKFRPFDGTVRDQNGSTSEMFACRLDMLPH